MTNTGVSRTPPLDVIRELRREVHFVCPAPGCHSPYLTWHHFDPQWADEQHHRPEGMIALCEMHHRMAGAGAFTAEQLVAMKQQAPDAHQVHGGFEWLRRDLLVVAGGNFYLNTDSILRIANRDVIWIERDAGGNALLNFWLPSTTGMDRAVMRRNTWVVPPGVADIDCPPSGRKLGVTYANGDLLSVEFRNVNDMKEFAKRFGDRHWVDRLRFPLTAMGLSERSVDTPIRLTPEETTIGSGVVIRGSLTLGGVGIQVDAWDASTLLTPAMEAALALDP